MLLQELQCVFKGQNALPRNVAFCGHPRRNAVWRTLRGSWAPAFLWGLASPAWNIRHSRRNAVWQALRALGTQITVEFGGPSADHGAPACLWGLANRARITRHLRSYVVWWAMRALGAQIAVWVGLPRAEPKAMALCKALRGKRCNWPVMVFFARFNESLATTLV